MKALFLLLFMFFSTSFAQGFISIGDQIICDGFVNQVYLSIANEITDSSGQSLAPKQFMGQFENHKPGEELTEKVIFMGINDNRFDIIGQNQGILFGFIEDFGQLSFGRVVADGSKHLTNCRYREL